MAPFQTSESLTDRIYEASVLPEFWPTVLRDFSTLANAREAVLLSVRDDSSRWIASSPLMDELVQGYYAYDGAHERTRRLVALQRAGFATDEDVFTKAELSSIPVYADFLVPRGYGRGIATAVHVPDGSTIVFHAEAGINDTPVKPSIIRELDGLRPHLARSALISARLDFERARTAVETLAALGMAACAVSANGTVIVANSHFEEATDYWTTRGGDRIALGDRRSDALLRESLARIDEVGALLSLPVVIGDDVAPAVLHAVPVRRAAHDLFGRAMAILVLTVAGSRSRGPSSLMQSLFDLTPAEANVAARIGSGMTADEIAAADGKSVQTVRNQLKAVLEKTGCHRQADLVRVLTQLSIG